MKTKTIKKILSNKIENWIESITDKKVKNAVRRDFIVTGGSIASMLLKEDVNDYDIYFKNKETVKLVSDYYVSKIKNNGIMVVDSDNIPKEPILNDEGNLSQYSVFIKGLINSKESRVKLFLPNVGYWRNDNYKKGDKETFEPIYLTENAITLSDDIQLVIRFFGDPEKIHENYDFVHATNYYFNDNGNYKLVLRNEALEALLTKQLVYIGSKYPLTSIIRTKKFLKRGYGITAGTYLKILWQVSELDLKDPIVLQEQLVGVDIAYFSLLIETISKVDPKMLNYNYISNIIDKIFND